MSPTGTKCPKNSTSFPKASPQVFECVTDYSKQITLHFWKRKQVMSVIGFRLFFAALSYCSQS